MSRGLESQNDGRTQCWTERGVPSAPLVFDQRHGVGMNKPLERRLEMRKFSLPMSERQNGWCHYPVGFNKYGFWLESALRNRTKNEQIINWSWSPLLSSRTCRVLRCKLSDRIELGPARRDWFSKNRRDPSHNRRKDSRPPESEVYAVLTSLSCFCS